MWIVSWPWNVAVSRLQNSDLELRRPARNHIVQYRNSGSSMEAKLIRTRNRHPSIRRPDRCERATNDIMIVVWCCTGWVKMRCRTNSSTAAAVVDESPKRVVIRVSPHKHQTLQASQKF